jgi:hypothetical protein
MRPRIRASSRAKLVLAFVDLVALSPELSAALLTGKAPPGAEASCNPIPMGLRRHEAVQTVTAIREI